MRFVALKVLAAPGVPDGLSRGLSITALIVSALALITAIITLWRTHFAKMKIIVAVGPATFRLSHFTGQAAKEWYMADFDMRIAFTNTGARAGRLLAPRVRVDYPDLPIPKAHEFFSLNAEVDSALYAEHADTALLGTGRP